MDAPDRDERDESDEVSRWGCLDVLVVFPLTALGTYLVRTRLGWGDAGWEDFVSYLGFVLVLELIVDSGRGFLKKWRRSSG
ncbi:MAG TPA: hypothetical protein VGW38_05185 [Chloroflexota bacterium]|nr:hypothetical protein [Chloroflexota bacterium]